MRKSADSDGAADVIVVGAGVAGLAAARALARRGGRVTVVERGRPGAEASDAAGGMLAPQAEADVRDELFELLCASRDMYQSFAQSLHEETGVDIRLDQTGTLYLAFNEEDEAELERRFAWQTDAGLCVERLTADDARRLEPSISERVRLALKFPRDWQVENRLLVKALVDSIHALGVRVLYEPVLGLRVEGGRVEGVVTSSGFLSAEAVVIAAGAWSSRLPFLTREGKIHGATGDDADAITTPYEHPRVEPVRGQMLCFDTSGLSFKEFASHVLYSPRGYLVPRRAYVASLDGDVASHSVHQCVLAGSTTEHVKFEKAVTASGIHSITSRALEIAPALGELALVDSWSGLRPRAEDGLPLLGESADIARLFYATGYYRNGILLAPATGEIVADLVLGSTTTHRAFDARTLEAFSPGRFRRSLSISDGK